MVEPKLRTARTIVFALLFMVGWLNASSVVASGFISKGRLLEVLSESNIDLILDTLSQIPAMRYQGEMHPILMDLWKGEKSKYPTLSWSTINLDIVRLRIANVLLQAERNRQFKIDKNEFREFTLTLVHSDDVDVMLNAIWNIGIINDPRDVDLLFDIARDENERTFKSAISSLTDMFCHEEAAIALDRLEELTETTYLREFIKDHRRKWAGFAKALGQSWC